MAVIEKRTRRDGTVTYRARIRLAGYPAYTQTFDRRSDAKAWTAAIEGDLKRGKHLPSREASRRTLAELVDRYVAETLPYKARNRNQRQVRQQLLWWKTQIGAVSVSNVTPALIAQWRDRLRGETTKRGERHSPATLNRYLAALSACFKTAINEYHWVDANPVLAVSKGPESAGITRYLSDDERRRLLDACHASASDWIYLLVLLALTTGARRAELLGLTWKDVDLQRGVIVFHETKNRDRRAVPIVGEAMRLLAQRSKVRRIDSDLVFQGDKKNRPPSIDKHWNAILAQAGIENFRFHDLRHTAASYLAMSGATVPEIAAVLGHRTLQMVKRYSHLSEQHTVGVLERMTGKFFAEG